MTSKKNEIAAPGSIEIEFPERDKAAELANLPVIETFRDLPETPKDAAAAVKSAEKPAESANKKEN